ncbi:hypothetical protein DIURU_001051 [Diutina rugosa]|uniref:Alcohol dehydrogenase-like C-terminal domain-containing protein n=1 Tax=Diutina rugosa TaxID=5481 RepID=A0A642UW35_DIURU|nr:uncharacterized protein DIURU_001051 [Diutina rugosa]KAA8906473.1 hypothetical protein DIURU_001051 [Diutina rugosa]
MQIVGGYRSGNVVDLGSTTANVPGNDGLFEVVVSTSDKYQVGDWVIPALPGMGTWRTSVAATVVPEGVLPFITVDKRIGRKAAEVLTINPPTAVALFHHVQDWRPGQWIVQNAGNSQVSHYVAQLARSSGVKVLSVVRDRSYPKVADQLKANGATKVVTESELLNGDVTVDGDVRLALDSVGGPTTEAMMHLLADKGILITYGVVSGQPVSYPGRLAFAKTLTATGFWLTKQSLADPQWKINIINTCVDLFRDGVFSVGDDITYVEATPSTLKQTYVRAIQASGKHVVVYNHNE